MVEQKAVVEVRDLCVDFVSKEQRFRVVDKLSFSLQKGETIGIVGESGSGKSVSMLSIMRLLDEKKLLYQGQILFTEQQHSIDILSLKNKEMRPYRGHRIAMIFQEPMTSLNPSMRCGRQVMETLCLHLSMTKKQAKQRTLELFEEVLLPDVKKAFLAYPHELSGGQKQRVMIAMAIACNPDVLIADEPTTALDVTVQKTILDLMKSLQQKHGMSIIFITHDLGVVGLIADKVLVMYKGQKVEEGAIKDIFNKPQHPYTKGLLACRVPLSCRLEHLPTVTDFLSEKENQFVSKEITQYQRLSEMQKLYAKEPLLRVENLSKRYPLPKKLFKRQSYFEAIKSISFDVFEGETLGLVGESGCGKTTLGRSILRLIEPSSGSVFYRGTDICKLPMSQMRNLRQQMQIVFQDPYSSLNPRHTVGNAIVEPMELHHIGTGYKQRKDKVMELLNKVGLSEKHFYAYPHEFSGGQRQRVCIARALAVNPKFLICDESVSALDVSVQAQVLNLLNDLKKEFQLTYIFISHDLSVVRYMSHRVLVMRNGVMQELNEADQLYQHPQTDYTKELIASIPIIAQ